MDVASGQLLHLRLFLEGIEVPVIAATVTAQIGSPSTAQIELVATDRTLELLARTTVHLFYLDFEKLVFEGTDGEVQGSTDLSEIVPLVDVGNADEADLLSNLRNQNYNLLFCGELFATSYVKSGFGQRSMVLQCLDFSNMWDTHYLYSLRYSNVDPGDGQGSAIVGNKATFIGARDGALDDLINAPELVVGALAGQRSSAHNPALRDTQDIVGALFAILELLGGVQGRFFGVNTWATIQERRVRLMDQLAGDSGETASRLFRQDTFEQWLTNQLGQAGGLISFRDLTNIINSHIYYEIAPNPVARYVLGEKSVPNWKKLDNELARSLQSRGLPGDLAQQLLDRGIASPATWSDNPLTGARVRGGRENLNPFFLEQLDDIEAELVRKGWNGSSPSKPQPLETSLLRKQSSGKHGLGHAADLRANGEALATGYDSRVLVAGGYDSRSVAKRTLYGRLHYHAKFPDDDSPLLSDDNAKLEILKAFWQDLHAAALARGLQTAGGGQIQTDEEGRKYTEQRCYGVTFREYGWASLGLQWDPVHIQTAFPKSQILADLAKGVYTGVPAEQAAPTRVTIGRKTETTPPDNAEQEGSESEPRERLITQIFRPDIWFVPPPTCNIVFPEEYSTLSYNRQMMREVTRLQLDTFNTIIGDGQIVRQYYFAPSFEDVESLTVGGLGSAAKAVIYPHEKFSGIIPKSERISEVSFYAMDADGGSDPLSQNLSNRETDETGQNAKTSANAIEFFASQVAAYNFLTSRYASRTGNVTGRFMPRLVCGFPALVVNRPESEELEPLHLLGMVVTVSHTLSQGGANSSASMTHVRSHRAGNRTDDLFSQALYDDDNILSIQKVAGTEVKTVIHLEPNDSSNPVSAADFYWATMARTHLLAEDDPQNPLSLTNVISAGRFKGPTGGILLRFEIAQSDRVDDEFLVFGQTYGRGDNPAENVVGHRFSFAKVTVVEEVGGTILPLEEAIRPAWVSDEYSNTRIGALYETFFGCKALTDVENVVPAEGSDILSIETAAEALVRNYSAHADGKSASAYIYGTTKREHATLVDVLGSFHEQAVAPHLEEEKTGLQGLDILGVPLTTQTGQNELQTIDQDTATRLDPRVDRASRVLDYLTELLSSQGLRG